MKDLIINSISIAVILITWLYINTLFGNKVLITLFCIVVIFRNQIADFLPHDDNISIQDMTDTEQ